MNQDIQRILEGVSKCITTD